jgi:hypothetical protein
VRVSMRMGRIAQGLVVFWTGRDLFGGALSYNGFGGVSLHIRDVLDVGDLRLVSSPHFEWQPGHGAT